MKKLMTICLLVGVVFISSANVFAVEAGAISTDSFGYTGSVVRYATLQDAQAGTNAIGTVTVDNRDLGLYIINDYAAAGGNYNVIMGSYWYTTQENTNINPDTGLVYTKDAPLGNRLYSGWGNTRGNTGVGFMQLYDAGADTVSSISMDFDNFNGTYWTEFDLSISGGNAGAADYSRFSAYDNVNDGGIWHAYNLALTASGLQGVEDLSGIIEAFNHPTGVSGSFTGLFELTENQNSPANQGFYTVNLTLDMTNWAFAQGDEALNGNFSDSYFATVPEPATMAILGLGALMCRKFKKA